MVSGCGVVSYIVHIDYKQLLDLNCMLGRLISYWASFRLRSPRQPHLRNVLEMEGLPRGIGKMMFDHGYLVRREWTCWELRLDIGPLCAAFKRHSFGYPVQYMGPSDDTKGNPLDHRARVPFLLGR